MILEIGKGGQGLQGTNAIASGSTGTRVGNAEASLAIHQQKGTSRWRYASLRPCSGLSNQSIPHRRRRRRDRHIPQAFGLAIRTPRTSQGRLWLAGGFTRRIRCGRRGNGQDPCQNFFVREAISVGSARLSVVMQSTACSRHTSSSTAVGFQSGAQSSRQSQPLAAQRIGRSSWHQRLQQMILFSDTSSCRGRQDGAMHQPLAVVDNPQRSCGRRRASRCRPLTKRGMSMLLTCLSYSSISCTHGMPMTFTMNGSVPRSSSAASPHEVKAARARARARARAATKASARPRHGWGQSQEEQQEETQDTT